eukprot:scaffold39576_cov60-Phaeocystis_antarctica.AAC.1
MQHAASNLSYSAQPRITRCIERHIAYHIGERRGGVRTISRRLSHPSPKLSNSSTVTSMTAVSSNTDGGGEGCGGIDGGGSAGVGGGGEGSTSAQLGAPKVAFTKKAARADLGEPRPTSVGERDASCLRRLSNASRSSNAVRCVGELGDCSHNLTVVTPPATTCMVKSSESVTLPRSSSNLSPLARESGVQGCRAPFQPSLETGSLPVLRHPVRVDLDAPRLGVEHGAGKEYVKQSWTSAHSARAGGGRLGGGYAGGGGDGGGGNGGSGGELGGSGGDGGGPGGDGRTGGAG